MLTAFLRPALFPRLPVHMRSFARCSARAYSAAALLEDEAQQRTVSPQLAPSVAAAPAAAGYVASAIFGSGRFAGAGSGAAVGGVSAAPRLGVGLPSYTVERGPGAAAGPNGASRFDFTANPRSFDPNVKPPASYRACRGRLRGLCPLRLLPPMR